MTISNYHPRCSIPYINIEKEPERKLENEKNKKQNGWQPGDGYVSEKSGFGVIHTFNETIDNYKKCLNHNPDLKERLAEASPFGSFLNGLCFAADSWDPNYCELIVKVGGKHLLEIGSGVEGDTPLICAIKSGASTNKSFEAKLIEKTITLLDLGANPNMANTAGRTPFWYAVEVNKNPKVIGLLLLKHPVMNPRASVEGEKLIKQAKEELVSQAKMFDLIEIRELFKAKNDKESTLKELHEDIFYEIVCKIIEVFKNDQHLPDKLKKDHFLISEEIEENTDEEIIIEHKTKSRCCIII